MGVVDGRTLWSFDRESLPTAVPEALVEALWRSVLQSSQRGQKGTEPDPRGLRSSAPRSLYWSAVREVVDPPRAAAGVHAVGGRVRHGERPRSRWGRGCRGLGRSTPDLGVDRVPRTGAMGFPTARGPGLHP